MQDEMWQIAVGTDSETNHQHCFYETSVTSGILTVSPPSGSHLTSVSRKGQSQRIPRSSHLRMSCRHVPPGLLMCALTPFFPLPPHNRTNLDPWDQYSDAQIWEALEKTHIKEMVSGCSRVASDDVSIHPDPHPPHPTFPYCPHICVSPPAGEPAASLAAVRGDGERRELLRGGTPATLRGPSPAAQQQGANCGNVCVGLVDGKCSVMPVTATPVTHSPSPVLKLFSHEGISLYLLLG